VRPRRVLIVDDDPLILDVLTTILDLEDLEVRSAPDGEAALDRLAEELPDVVVCDVMMPGIDGLEVCRRIKTNAATADVPVILLTARDRAEDRAAGEAAGCDAYLTKPFSPLDLIDQIAAVADLAVPEA
jgi:two-component system alkaline phosphatase synthesis response regulator PhoP